MRCQPRFSAKVNPPQKRLASKLREPIWLVRILKRTDAGRVDVREKSCLAVQCTRWQRIALGVDRPCSPSPRQQPSWTCHSRLAEPVPRGKVTNRRCGDCCLTRVGNTIATEHSAPSRYEARSKHASEDGVAERARESACGAHKGLGLPRNHFCRPPLNPKRA